MVDSNKRYYDPANTVYVSKSTKSGDFQKEINENVERRKKNALELKIDERVESILSELGKKEVISSSGMPEEACTTIRFYGDRQMWIGKKNDGINEVRILMYWGGLIGYLAGWKERVYHSKNGDSSNNNVLIFKKEEKWLGKLEEFYKKAARAKAKRELKGKNGGIIAENMEEETNDFYKNAARRELKEKEMNLAGVIYKNIEEMDNFGIGIREERRRAEK